MKLLSVWQYSSCNLQLAKNICGYISNVQIILVAEYWIHTERFFVVGSVLGLAWLSCFHISRLTCRFLSLLSKWEDIYAVCLAESHHSAALNSIKSLEEGAGFSISVMTYQSRTKELCVAPYSETQGRRSVSGWVKYHEVLPCYCKGPPWIVTSILVLLKGCTASNVVCPSKSSEDIFVGFGCFKLSALWFALVPLEWNSSVFSQHRVCHQAFHCPSAISWNFLCIAQQMHWASNVHRRLRAL